MLYTAALLSAAMLLAGCYSTDTDDDLLSTAPIMKHCINLPSAVRKRIGWWGSTPLVFSPFSITVP